MYVIAGTTPYSDWAQLQELLQQVGIDIWKKNELDWWCARFIADSGSNPGASHTGRVQENTAALFEGMPQSALLATDAKDFLLTLEYWIQAFKETHLMLFYTRPQSALAKALVQDEDLTDARDIWQSAAEQILACYRHNRRRVTLIDSEAALRNPKSFLVVCGEYLTLPPGPVVSGPENEDTTPEVCRLIGAQFVGQSDALVDLARELEASSRPLDTTDHTDRIDCRAVYNEYRLAQERAARVEELERDKASLQERAARVEELERDNELQLLQLHQVQEELEDYYLRTQKLTSEKQALNTEKQKLSAELASKTQEVEALRHSISWKITAPLRILLSPVIELWRRKRLTESST